MNFVVDNIKMYMLSMNNNVNVYNLQIM